MSKRYTRQQFLGALGASAAGVASFALPGCGPEENSGAGAQQSESAVQAANATGAHPGTVQSFRSRPDLTPPKIEVTKSARGTASGHLFVAAKNGVGGEEHPSQDGPMILDGDGQPVWLLPVLGEEDAMDFRVQRYRGEPVLTWWQGVHEGWGQGEYLVYDRSYREIARFGAVGGYAGDHHEFVVTARDTALIGIYSEVPMDLSPLGGPVNGAVMEGVVQEIEIETGAVLFEWHSLDHVSPEESYDKVSPNPEEVFDYFHLNSIEVDNDENLIIAGRRMSAAYKVDRGTGEVIWRLGGKNSDFEMGIDTRFAYQHDVRRQPDGTISIFDNRGEEMHEPSRGIVLALDEEAMQVTLLHEYIHPGEVFGIFQGNLQILVNGNAFIGWGSAPYISEFSSDGRLLFEARFPEEVESYRAYRSQWTGRPEEAPAFAVERGARDEIKVYVSWNGSTEVSEWEVLAGPDSEAVQFIGAAPRQGFETAINVQTDKPYISVKAKDRSGRVLGSVGSALGRI